MKKRTAGDIDPLPLIVADIYELAGLLRARGERIAAAIGQSQARWQVLSAASGEQLLTVPQIARRLGLTRQAIQRIADLLVTEGLARYAGNPDHKASPHLAPTKAGADTLARLTRAARASHQELAANLDGIDLAVLRRDLRALLTAFNGSNQSNEGA